MKLLSYLATKTKLSLTLPLGFVFLLMACAPMRPPVPEGVIPTAKSPTPEDEAYGHTVLTTLSEKFPVEYNDPRLDKVNEIVERLAKAAGADKDPWHVFLFQDSTFKNAGATRGNHVFIWTGMLDAVENDEELAMVLAHEIAHVLAGHTDPDPNEEIKKMLINVGAMAAGIAVSVATKDPSLGDTLGRLTGALTEQVASGMLVYPYSRETELEADHIGLMLMAKAKFNPELGVKFWEKAQNSPDFSNGLAFFSTHPVAEERLARLRKLVPQAMQYYRGEPNINSFLNTGTNTITDSGGVRRSAYSVGSGSEEIWRVVSNGAEIYERSDSNSRKLRSLEKGDTVSVLRTRKGWLELIYPISGFIEGKNLEPLEIN